MNATLIVPSGGTGERTGLDTPKQYLEIGGKTILNWTLSKFEQIEQVTQLIIPADMEFVDIIEASIPQKFKHNYTITEQGTTRFDSIYKSIGNIDDTSDFVIIHDAVRPYVTTELINKLLDDVLKYRAVVPFLNPTDTIKCIDTEKEENFVYETLDRELLAAVQTPQIFDRRDFTSAYEYAKENQFKGTDDSSILEYSDIFPKLIFGEVQNTKITTKIDIEIAKFLLKS